MNTTETDLVEQVSQLRADLERHRLDPEVMWITRSGRTRHLLHGAFVDHRRTGEPAWTFCHIMLTDLAPAAPDDDRSVCRKCENARRERHNWKTVQAEREDEQRRQRAEERQERDARNAEYREQFDADFAELDDTLARIEAMTALTKEQQRRTRLRRGEHAQPRLTIEQMRQRTLKLRAENDRIEAEMIAAAS